MKYSTVKLRVCAPVVENPTLAEFFLGVLKDLGLMKDRQTLIDAAFLLEEIRLQGPAAGIRWGISSVDEVTLAFILAVLRCYSSDRILAPWFFFLSAPSSGPTGAVFSNALIEDARDHLVCDRAVSMMMYLWNKQVAFIKKALHEVEFPILHRTLLNYSPELALGVVGSAEPLWIPLPDTNPNLFGLLQFYLIHSTFSAASHPSVYLGTPASLPSGDLLRNILRATLQPDDLRWIRHSIHLTGGHSDSDPVVVSDYMETTPSVRTLSPPRAYELPFLSLRELLAGGFAVLDDHDDDGFLLIRSGKDVRFYMTVSGTLSVRSTSFRTLDRIGENVIRAKDLNFDYPLFDVIL